MKPSLPEVVEDYVPSQRMPSKVYSFFLSKGISPKLIDYLFTQPKLEVIVKIKEEIWNRRNSIESDVEDKLIADCVKSLAQQILEGIHKDHLKKARKITNKSLITIVYRPDNYLLSRIEESLLSYLLNNRYYHLKTSIRNLGSRIDLTKSEIQVILAGLSEYATVTGSFGLIYSGDSEVKYIFPGLLASPTKEKDANELNLINEQDWTLQLVVIYLNLREYLVYQGVALNEQQQVLDLLEKLRVPQITYHLDRQIWDRGYIKIANTMPLERLKRITVQEDIQILDQRLHNALMGDINTTKVLNEINMVADYFMRIKQSLENWTLSADEQPVMDYFNAVDQLRSYLNNAFRYNPQGEA